MNGVLIVNKPQDFTSFDVVAVVRKLTGQKKIGHTGTLDPMATGVLPLLLGKAAKAQSILPDSNKEYIAQLKFGVTTDTLDITGTELTNVHSNVCEQDFVSVASQFTGEIMQLPPMYSAVKVNGRRLYELAREGKEVERSERKVTIFNLDTLSFDSINQTATIRVACSSGTYIRTLISDIGEKLGCGAVMTALERTSACGYTINDSHTIDELRAMQPGEIEVLLQSTESIFTTYREIQVSPAQSARFSNGGALDIMRTSLKSSAVNNEILRVHSSDNTYLGLGITDTDEQLLKIFKLF